MATRLPAVIALSRHEDLRLEFALVDTTGAAVAVAAGAWQLAFGASLTIPATLKAGTTNVLQVVALVADLDKEIAVGFRADCDLQLVANGASSVFASVTILRGEVMQSVAGTGLRAISVTRSAGLTVSVDLSTVATAVAAYATQAGAARTAADADAVATAADRIAVHADKVASDINAATATTQAGIAAGHRAQTDADAVATAADRVQTAADRAATGADRTAVHSDKVSSDINAATATTQAGIATTQAGLAAANKTAADADAVATAADRVQTGLDRVQTGADRVQTGSDRTNTAALLASFRNVFLGAFASDGAAASFATTYAISLISGVMYENQTSGKFRIYSGSAWGDYDATAAASQTAAALSASNAATAKAAADADVVLTHADVVLTHADVVLTHADAASTAADRAAVSTDKGTTHADKLAADADLVITHADVVLTHADVVLTHADATQTALDRAATHADKLATDTNVTTAGNSATAAAGSLASVTTLQSSVSTLALQAQGYMGSAAASAANAQAVAQTNLNAAARAIALATDVTAVFVYDTTKDTDGGAWRKKVAHTSWMNETLNTATRGVRQDFPSKALIVCRGAISAAMTIYDLDDPTCPMWMVFASAQVGASWATSYFLATGNGTSAAEFTSISALNGMLYVGDGYSGGAFGVGGMRLADLIADRMSAYNSPGTAYQLITMNGGLSSRNSQMTCTNTTGGLASQIVNDVTATILPNTPLNPLRANLPNPTVAVATAGGVSVIRADGMVCNGSGTAAHNKVSFGKDNSLLVITGAMPQLWTHPSYLASGGGYAQLWNAAAFPQSSNSLAILTKEGFATNGSKGLTCVILNRFSLGNDVGAQISDKYNTGYMPAYTTKLALSESIADLSTLTGITYGAENVANGSFGTGDLTGWTPTLTGTGSATVSGGVATLTGGTGTAQLAQTLTGLVLGSRYRFRFTNGTAAISAAIGPVAAASFAAQANALEFTASATSQAITFAVSAGVTATVTAVSVQVVSGLAFFDGFDQYADTAAMVAGGWVAYNGQGTRALVGGKLRYTGNGTAADGIQRSNIAAFLTPGRTYVMSIDYAVVSTPTTTSFNFNFSGSGYSVLDNSNVTPLSTGSAGTKTVRFTAGAVMNLAILTNSANDVIDFDNFKICLMANDRSVAGNSPVVYGSVTRSAVASGAEMVGYGGFSGANFLEVPYSAGLDFGTGDFMLATWFNQPSSAFGNLFTYGAGATAGYFLDTTGATGFRFVANGVNQPMTAAWAVGAWNHVVFVRVNGVSRLYLNGVFAVALARPENYSAVGAVLRIANSANTTTGGGNSSNNGSIALPRVAAYAPTPDQIRAMYEFERGRFQANDKCLLVGSPNVQALAYDQDTDQLSVATAVGTNVFKGLQRIGYQQSTTGINLFKSFSDLVTGSMWTSDANGGTGQVVTARSITFANATAARVYQSVSGQSGIKDYTLSAKFTAADAGKKVRFAVWSSTLNGVSTGLSADLTIASDGTVKCTYPSVNGLTIAGIVNAAAGTNQTVTFADSYGMCLEVGAVATFSPGLSYNDNHKFIAASDGITTIGTAAGVDLFMPAKGLREAVTKRLPMPVYDPTWGVYQGVTTDATPTVIAAVPVPEGKCFRFRATVAAAMYGGTATEKAAYDITGIVTRDLAGNAVVVSTTGTVNEVTSTMDAICQANTTAQTLEVKATGKAATRIAWGVEVEWYDIGLMGAA
ncbi:MAG: hypothetical protein JWM36_3260 [Hyphomicrobiales bacterium]|nr:hypothetical protein [Hyphomicrobiales bacterium]